MAARRGRTQQDVGNTHSSVWGVLLALLAGLTLGISPCAANPDRTTFQSALVWRVDGTGDEVLPELDEGTTYQLPEAIKTTGKLTTLTATWIFEGLVSLELSADGGAHYTPAVYGVPLQSELVSGNRLMWRTMLGADSHLTEVKIVYTDSSGVMGTFGEPELSGFQFRKPIVINGSPPGELFQYQVRLLIGESEQAVGADVHGAGHLRSDFADIRLTTADGQTVLPHYLERITGVSPARLAIVWVKVPQIPPHGLTLYLYYGHPTAANRSDGAAVFDFFDDFQGAGLDVVDPEVWEVHLEGEGSAVGSKDQLHLTSASLLSKTFQMTDGIVELLATAPTSQDDVRLIIRSDPSASDAEETTQVAYASAYGGAEHALAVGNVVKANALHPLAAHTPYAYRVMANGTSVIFERYDAAFTTLQATVTFEDVGGLTHGALGVHSDGSALYDWIRVRQLADQPPAVSKASAPAPEETANLPVFSNTLVAPNGNVVLADSAAEGTYRSTGILTNFPIRILVPQWQGDLSAVDLSADGGHTYHLGCLRGRYYYASKKTFKPGKQLHCHLTLAPTDLTPATELQTLTVDYAPGVLSIVSPNGGERVAPGTTQEIVWSAVGHERTYPMRLDYSLDGGKTYQPISEATDNDGTHPWSVPDGVTSGKALVRVADGHDPDLFDTSDAVFMVGLSSVETAASLPRKEPREETGEETEDLLKLLETLSAAPHATPHELLIKITESPGADPTQQALSYHAGDIVLIRPAGAEWSETEQNSFLILQADLTPEAVASLMSPIEVPTGEVDQDGQPIMQTRGRRKFHIDLGFFDLKPRASDEGQPAVRRYFKQPEYLEGILKERVP